MFKKLLLTILILFPASEIFSSDFTFAFGYLKNSSKDHSYDYLEKVFSNSIVSSLIGKNINLLRASDINSALKKKGMELGYEFTEEQLVFLCDETNADYFMYGKFLPLDDYYVRLVISIYSRNTNELFTFETTGRLEAEIFSLIDVLSSVLLNVTNSRVYYKKDVIPANSKFDIITNLSPSELNEMYSVFLDNKYRVSTVQSSDLENTLSSDELMFFYNIISTQNSYKKLQDTELKKETNFIYGSWMDKTDIQEIKDQNDFINFYYYDYPESKRNLLKKLSQSTKNNDYLLIIHFNRRRTEAFIRCIDYKTGNLIWMERNVTPGKESEKKYKSRIMQQTDEIIKHFFLTSNRVNEDSKNPKKKKK